MKTWIVFLCTAPLLALLAASCASTQAQTAPLWVTDLEQAYPNARWLRVVDEDEERDTAEAKALQSLAQIFRLDIAALTQTYTQLENQQTNSKSKSSAARRLSIELQAASSVSNIIGARKELWTNKATGTVYALAYMNRAECARRYQSLIEENETSITALTTAAENADGGFESWRLQRTALPLAELNDTFWNILSVLDPSQENKRPAHSAAALRTSAMNYRSSITVTLHIAGDIDQRIAAAFNGAFAAQNIAAAGPTGRCTLEAHVTLTPLGKPGPYWETRWTVTAALRDTQTGAEILRWAANNRESHPASQDSATNRALLAIEEIVASEFTAHLDAVLGE